MKDENYQARSSRIGRAYERQVEAGLENQGWTIKKTKWREPLADIEIDIVAVDPDGVETWIECKGSLSGSRAGAKRTDSVKKFIGDCALVFAMYEQNSEHERRPYLLITSDLPEHGSAHRQLEAAVAQGWCKIARFPMQIEFL